MQRLLKRLSMVTNGPKQLIIFYQPQKVESSEPSVCFNGEDKVSDLKTDTQVPTQRNRLRNEHGLQSEAQVKIRTSSAYANLKQADTREHNGKLNISLYANLTEAETWNRCFP